MGVETVSNSNKTVDIFYSPARLGKRGLNGGVQIREIGKKVSLFGDSSFKTEADVLKTAQSFLNEGYNIENIRINGQPITDKFQKNEDGKYELVARHEGDTFESKPSTMKKVGTGAASAVIPGVGQVLNGDYKKAGWIVVGNILLPEGSVFKPLLRCYAAYDAYKNADKPNEAKKNVEETKS